MLSFLLMAAVGCAAQGLRTTLLLPRLQIHTPKLRLSSSFPYLNSPKCPYPRLFCTSSSSSSLQAITVTNALEESDNNKVDDEEEQPIEVAVAPPPPPPPVLSMKERKELASYAHGLGKKLKSQQVGKSGVTPAVAAAFMENLESNELLKLKLHGSCPGELSDAIRQLEKATGSIAIDQIGRSVIVYRPSLSKLKKREAASSRKSQGSSYSKMHQKWQRPGVSDEGQRTPRVFGQGQRTPRVSGQGQRTPRVSDEGQQTPRVFGQGQRTPRVFGQGQRTPRISDEGQRTPRVFGQGPRTPRVSGQGQRTPRVFGQGQRTPRVSDEGQRTPRVSGQGQRTPRVSDQGQRQIRPS